MFKNVFKKNEKYSPISMAEKGLLHAEGQRKKAIMVATILRLNDRGRGRGRQT